MTTRQEDARIVIVGAGPGGLVLAVALVQKSHAVTLLEQHHSFDREFRGELVQPGGLAVFDRLRLLEGVLGLPHERAPRIELWKDGRRLFELDYERLGGPYGAALLVPQPVLLEYLYQQANQTGLLTFVRGARVRGLLWKGERVSGVEASVNGDRVAYRADLVAAADGRYSTLRKRSCIGTFSHSVPADVVWFTLPRPHGWPNAIRMVSHGGDVYLFLPNRGERLQIGLVIPKGSYQSLKEQPIEWLRERVKAAEPSLEKVLREHLQGWSDVVLLPVESEMAESWWRPGLLLLGDAAHVMSPVAGQGINVAIQDAYTASLYLHRWLAGDMTLEEALASFERKRYPLVQATQTLQNRLARLLTQGAKYELLLSIAPRIAQATGVWRRVAWPLAYGYGIDRDLGLDGDRTGRE